MEQEMEIIQGVISAVVFENYDNGRLLLQAGWIIVAILVPHIHVVAAAVPLLFPNLVIFYLQSKGKLVEPSERKNPPADEQEEPEDHLGSFEV